MTDAKALQLVSLFAIPPNNLHLCGESDAAQKLYSYLDQGNRQGLAEVIDTFSTLAAQLKIIADFSGVDPLSPQAISCYILGNELCTKATLQEYHLLIDNIALRKKQHNSTFPSKEWIEKMETLREQRMGKIFIPTHNFWVFTTQELFDLGLISNCMVRWGIVKHLKGNQAEVSLKSPSCLNGSYKLTNLDKTMQIDKKYLVNITQGDKVATHWNTVITKLTGDDAIEEKSQLIYWTIEVLKVLP